MSSKLAIARAYLRARFPRKATGIIPTSPICDEQHVAENFPEFNALGLTLEDARALARAELETGATPHPGYSFGLSTGTTGEPGVFITTQAERDRWLGTILGKFLTPVQLLQLNAALLLKHNNRLYQGSQRVHYFDLTNPTAHWAPRLCDLAPNVLIGPPSALTALADSAAFQRRPFQPHTLLSGAEVLFPQDREKLRRAFQVPPQNLYQAKEGFLAAGCKDGAMHWNEDLMLLEGMRFKCRPDRVVPVITDVTRESQVFRRYRIDDVLVISQTCACRTPFQKVTTVEGRLQDILLLHNDDGTHTPLFPLDLNRILEPAGDYALKQHDAGHFTLECAASPKPEVLAALRHVLREPERLDLVPLRSPVPGQKRRRFQRMFDPLNWLILDKLLEPAAPLNRLR
jgi:putative adenylate-forming enzyme